MDFICYFLWIEFFVVENKEEEVCVYFIFVGVFGVDGGVEVVIEKGGEMIVVEKKKVRKWVKKKLLKMVVVV